MLVCHCISLLLQSTNLFFINVHLIIMDRIYTASVLHLNIRTPIQTMWCTTVICQKQTMVMKKNHQQNSSTTSLHHPYIHTTNKHTHCISLIFARKSHNQPINHHVHSEMYVWHLSPQNTKLWQWLAINNKMIRRQKSQANIYFNWCNTPSFKKSANGDEIMEMKL